MRFVAAIVSFVLAFTLIGLGLAQRTIFAGPDRLVAEGSTSVDAPVAVIDGAALHAHEGRQRLEISGAETIVAVYGRTADVDAWVGEAAHNRISYDTESVSLESQYVAGAEDEVPSAIGSDLWFAEYVGEGSLTFSAGVPHGYSVLIMSDGIEPAPASFSVAWPVDTRTPWAGPLIVAGVVLLALGALLYLWALHHWRATRGPRRRSGGKRPPKLPRVPRPSRRDAARALKSGVSPAGVPESGRRGRRMTAVAVFTAGAIALSGCSPDLWPDLSAPLPSPSPSPSAEGPDGAPQRPPVGVTEAQIDRIMADVARVAQAADEALDDDLIATRFEGPALEMRLANYVMRRADAAQPAPAAVVGRPIQIVLPQQTDAWPRVAMVVVQDASDESVVPTAYVLHQASPRVNYRVQYAVMLQPTAFPDLEAPTVGAVRYSPDNKFLKMAPEDVAAAYSDVLAKGAESEFADEFDLESDTFLAIAGPEARAARAEAVSGPAQLTTEAVAGSGERIALATDDTGAVLTLNFGDMEKITPTEAGAEIMAPTTVRLLSGLEKTTKGMFVTYGYQLLFYVPPAGSDEKIRLLGATEGVITAGELEE